MKPSSTVVTPTGPQLAGHVLRDAWVATGTAAGLVLAGMLVVSTFEEGSVLGLVGALVLLVAGLTAVVLGIVWAIRAIRLGRTVAMAPLLLAAIPVFYGLVATLGAFGRFFGWDG